MTNPQYYKSAIDATGCISNAWNLIKPNYWLYFGISFVALLIMWALSCIPIVGIALTAPITGGIYFVALRAMRGEPVDFGMMFKGFEKFVPLLIVGIVQGIPAMIGQVLNIIFRVTDGLIQATQGSREMNFLQAPGASDLAIAGGVITFLLVLIGVWGLFSIAWAITFAFAVPIAMDQNVDAMTAIKLSARASWGNVGGIIVLSILLWLIGVAGVLALCIGILFVLPVIHVAWAFAYRQVFPDLNPTVFHNEPPPPDAYRGSFGQGL